MNFNNLYKIRIANPGKSFRKHEIVKLILVCEIMYKTRYEKKYHEIYTEHKFNGKSCDVYHKDLKTGKETCWEIQKNVSKKWLEETMRFYDNLNLYWELIDLNKLSDDLNVLNKQIKKMVVV